MTQAELMIVAGAGTWVKKAMSTRPTKISRSFPPTVIEPNGGMGIPFQVTKVVPAFRTVTPLHSLSMFTDLGALYSCCDILYRTSNGTPGQPTFPFSIFLVLTERVIDAVCLEQLIQLA